MVTAIIIKPHGFVEYELSCGASSSSHYEIEVSETIDQNIQLGIVKMA